MRGTRMQKLLSLTILTAMTAVASPANALCLRAERMIGGSYIWINTCSSYVNVNRTNNGVCRE
jgi:hypothetical protein